MRFRIAVLLVSIVLFICHVAGQDGYSRESAEKVLDIIDSLLLLENSGGIQNATPVVLSEKELNAYIAYRIENEGDNVMKELKLRILDKNRIEGKLSVDLNKTSLPGFLRPEMTFYFSGLLETDKGQARLDLKELFLENKRIQTQILDLILFLSAKVLNQDPVKIRAWTALPLGIRIIKTQKGKAVFYFKDPE